MLLIKNCNLINMADIIEEEYDLLIEDDKIIKIEKEIDGSSIEDLEIIDAKGRLVTPGFIEPHCHMGIYETAAREGMDGNEDTNPAVPHLRAIDAIDPMDAAYKVAIRHGVTTVVAGPGSANIIGGTFAAMKTHGNILEDILINGEVSMKMALGENPKISYGKRNKAPATRMMSAAIMREELYKSKEYYEKYKEYKEKSGNEESQGFDYDLRLHSLMRVFEGMNVKIHAHQADDILTGIRIAEEFGLRYTIDHCTEGYLIADELKKRNVRCIIGPVAGGKSKLECRNISLESAAILESKGIEFAIMTDHPVIPIEGQLMQLALLVKHGLSPLAALKGVTINAAKLNDIDHRIGSIEVGKDADVVIWNIHPLETMSEAGIVIINGKVVYENKGGEVNADYQKM